MILFKRNSVVSSQNNNMHFKNKWVNFHFMPTFNKLLLLDYKDTYN